MSQIARPANSGNLVRRLARMMGDRNQAFLERGPILPGSRRVPYSEDPNVSLFHNPTFSPGEAFNQGGRIYVSDPNDYGSIAHERVHVNQGRVLGRFYDPAYSAISSLLRVLGRNEYGDHPFERAAERARHRSTPRR